MIEFSHSFERKINMRENGEVRTLSSSGGIFSGCRKWRYTLWRRWNEGVDVVFIGLNPSTATEYEDDPTIRRCGRFAYSWGYSGMVMLNMFAYRSTDPGGLLGALDPIGPENDMYIDAECKKAKLIIAAWGVHGKLKHNGVDRHKLLIDNIPNLHCLGVTKDGYPKHPLYLKQDLKPVRYDECVESSR